MFLFRHNSETQKIKNMHEAAEKLRRERWIEDKTKKIKVRFTENRSAMLTNDLNVIDCHHIEYTFSLTGFFLIIIQVGLNH